MKTKHTVVVEIEMSMPVENDVACLFVGDMIRSSVENLRQLSKQIRGDDKSMMQSLDVTHMDEITS